MNNVVRIATATLVHYRRGKFIGEQSSPAHDAHVALSMFLNGEDEQERNEAWSKFIEAVDAYPDETRAVIEQFPWTDNDLGKEARDSLLHEIDVMTGAVAPAPILTLASIPERPVNYKSKLRFPADITSDDVLANNYLVKGWIDRTAEAMIFGTWNVGKTFVVLDLLACLALGAPWFGARVRQSKVLYLAYEGHAGMKRRMQALRGKYPALDDAPFAWWPMRHAITSPKGLAELKDARYDFAQRFGAVPDLLAIDPFRNALGGSDSDPDKIELLRAQTRALAEADKCTILWVHHTGHSNTQRERGDSGIAAGVDTSLRVDGPERSGGPSTIVAHKERDSVKNTVYFRLPVVELGVDSDGDPVTTCVVEPATAAIPGEMPEFEEPNESQGSKIDKAGHAVLRLLYQECTKEKPCEHSIDSLKRLGPSVGISRNLAELAIDQLIGTGIIKKEETGNKSGRPYRLIVRATAMAELAAEGAGKFF